MSGNRMAYYLWIMLGVVVALVMPLTAVVTAASVQVVADDSVPFLMLVIIAIISFAAHVLVLFGGRLAHASKTYCYFATKRSALMSNVATARVDTCTVHHKMLGKRPVLIATRYDCRRTEEMVYLFTARGDERQACDREAFA